MLIRLFFTLLMGCVISCYSETLTDTFSNYDVNNYLYYNQDFSYKRNDYQWYLKNTGQNSILYFNGLINSIENGGDVDTKYIDALNQKLIPNIINIKIAIIDSGVYTSHPDFEGIIFSGQNFSSDDVNDISDSTGHGTSTAGILLAKKNNIGISGLLNITNITVCKTSFRGSLEVVNSIQYCINNNIKIINIPWGTAYYDVGLSNIIYTAQQQGIIIVCSAPNADVDVDTSNDYPSTWKFDNVVTVTSITRTGIKYSPAGWGKNTVHLGAPGRILATTWNNNQYQYIYNSGTSFATPMVTACLTMLMEKYPNQTYKYHIERLLRGVDKQNDILYSTISGGRLNFVKSLLPDVPDLFWDIKNDYIRLYVNGYYDNGLYVIQSTKDFITWTNEFTTKRNGLYKELITEPHKFFRAKLL